MIFRMVSTQTRRNQNHHNQQRSPLHVISIWPYIDIKNYIWLLQSAISLFFVNLQLGFVFVVLNLFGEKRKKSNRTGSDGKWSCQCMFFFLFVIIWLSINIGVIYTVLDGADETHACALIILLYECTTVLFYGVPIVDFQIFRHADEHDQLTSLRCFCCRVNVAKTVPWFCVSMNIACFGWEEEKKTVRGVYTIIFFQTTEQSFQL